MNINFSVILPNYNHARFLKQRIESILNQTHQQFELIILDDCSKDESRAVIELYRHHPLIKQVIYNDKNSGSPFHQWKKGIELASNEWIWIAESDDYAHPRFLEKMDKNIGSNTAAALYYCDSFISDENKHVAHEKFSERKNRRFHTSKWAGAYCNNGIDEINECLKYDCTVNNASSMVFRKSLTADFIQRLETFTYYGDWYFIISICLKGNICYLDEPLNYYRKHASSHLHAETSLEQSRNEYFSILRLLYNQPGVKEKPKLLKFFTLNYLGFGLAEDGLKTGFRIFSLYFQQDVLLACKTLLAFGWVKLSRQKWKAETEAIPQVGEP